jgi:peptide/nickel transport system substrate-binding protein
MRPSVLARLLSAFAVLGTLAGCGGGNDKDAIVVSVVGDAHEIVEPLKHIESRAGQISFAATAQGLVTYNLSGDAIPALAQRWIVVDDGKSYIFRLRRARWADSAKVDARDVRKLLNARIRAMAEQDPYGPLSSIDEVLAMTADVIEIRLKTPRPDFLVALASPAMGIALSDGGTGPYRQKVRKNSDGALILTPVETNGSGETPPIERENRLLRSERASKAIMRFASRQADLMLGGTLAEMPYVTLADIDRNAVRFDAVSGLFGLALSPGVPLFEDDNIREALSLAIEREAIIAYFEMNRWKIASQALPQQLDLPHPPTVPPWAAQSMEDRRNRAAGVILRWKAQHHGAPAKFTIATPAGPGMRLLFLALKAQFALVGVEVEQVSGKGDMTLIDEVAPYDSAAWYLGRLSCARKVHCSPEAEELLKASASAQTMAEKLDLLGQAEPLVQAHNGFIPLATPVRWSLVSNRLQNYAASPRGYHDLRTLE